MSSLKQLMQGDKLNPKSPLAPNVRPRQEVHARTVRTNIYFPIGGKPATSGSTTDKTGTSEDECPDIFTDFRYESAFNSALESP